MARVKCQACGKSTEEGLFCEKCGAELAGGYAPAAASAPAFAQPEPARDPVFIRTPPEVRAPRVVVLEPAVEAPHACEPATPARAGRSAAEPVSAACELGDCPWLLVENDKAGFFVAGTPGLLRLRLTAQEEGLLNLRVGLSLACATCEPVPPFELYRPKALQQTVTSLSVPPLKPGAYVAELTVSFVRASRTLRFKAGLDLFVYPSDSSAQQIAESIVITINNDIKMGHASDVRQSLDAAGLLGNVKNNGKVYGVPELLDLLKNEMCAFRGLPLSEVEGSDEGSEPPSGARTDSLTLQLGGRLLHLLAGRRITLGKHRSNRVVTRLFDGAGVATEALNERISKRHCTLELDGSECLILDGVADDGGAVRRSAWGVFWQGRPVEGCARLPAASFPRAAPLALVGAEGPYAFRLTAHGCYFDAARCAACPDTAAGRPCGKGRYPALVLERADAVPERYAVLWACLDLGLAFPGCAGAAVCHERGAFQLRAASGAREWLTPGMRLPGGVEVRAFAQRGL